MRKQATILYGIAFVISCATVAAGALNVRSTRAKVKSLIEQSRQSMKVRAEAGQWPSEMKNSDIDNMRDEEFGMQVPSDLHIRMDISGLLEEFDFIWVPLVFLICFGIAAAIDWWWRAR